MGSESKGVTLHKKNIKRLEENIANLRKAKPSDWSPSQYEAVVNRLEEAQHNLAIEKKSLIEAEQKGPDSYEANYVDITPEVKALAEEGFSYFMPPGGGKGRAAAPAQPASTLPASPIMPRVKLTEEEKEDSRRLLNLLKEKGI